MVLRADNVPVVLITGVDAATGVPETIFDAAPAATEFTAFSFTSYDVPLLSPETRIGEVVCAGDTAV